MKKFDIIYLSMLANFVVGDHALDGRKSLADRLFFQALEDIYSQKYRENGVSDPLEHVPAFSQERMNYRLYYL